MLWPQITVFLILGLALFGFAWGRWRYDVVAVATLLLGVLVGAIPADRAFSGFGHPAVITVAGVLILSRAIQNSGVMNGLTLALRKLPNNITVQIAVITGLVMVASAFMNNVGALALMLPIVLRIASTKSVAPSLLFMPLAFGSMLGGMCTLIGTPPNIIVATFQLRETGMEFAMFDFAPVGVVVSLVGLTFMALYGWRLIPLRRQSIDAVVDAKISDYTAEVRIPRGAEFAGKSVRELEETAKSDITVLALIRRKRKTLAPNTDTRLAEGDRLLVKVDPITLKQVLEVTGFVLLASPATAKAELSTENVHLAEVLVRPGSNMEGRTAGALKLHGRFGVNLIGISRAGQPIRDHIGSVRFRRGDVLLLQGSNEALKSVSRDLDAISLGRLSMNFREGRNYLVPGVFACAVLLTALGVLPVQISLMVAVLVVLGLKALTLYEVYKSIDWPIIVLLAAMMPLGEALETTGAAHSVASLVLWLPDGTPGWIFIVLLMILAMVLSNLVNNAATALLMAPIAVDLALQLGYSTTPFLMAVAVASSTAFLTPIGHQSNLLVMGPGGYQFADYWRLGLPLSLLVVAVATPAIAWVFPL